MPINQTVVEDGKTTVKIWGTQFDENTILQVSRAGRLPILAGPVALMPDGHVGRGATVGSVIATEGAVIPAAVGVDLGCGMIACLTDLTAEDLPANFDKFLPIVERVIPAGVGQGHDQYTKYADVWFQDHGLAPGMDTKMANDATKQFGSLGAGNHFVEVCLDEKDRIWLVLHSGSRGVGNKLAQKHIAHAKKDFRTWANTDYFLDDPDLSWFVQGTPDFDAYIADMLWAQGYAMGNRVAMMAALQVAFFRFMGRGQAKHTINCHHNFCVQENHGGRDVWVTRKGAIRAEENDYGIIPGSMGARSFIIKGRGNPESWNSCSHGAGRLLSRTAAKKQYSAADLAHQMKGIIWSEKQATRLVDEIPKSYKDIDEVMAAQQDLVEVVATLHQVLNFKGT